MCNGDFVQHRRQVGTFARKIIINIYTIYQNQIIPYKNAPIYTINLETSALVSHERAMIAEFANGMLPFPALAAIVFEAILKIHRLPLSENYPSRLIQTHRQFSAKVGSGLRLA